MKLWRVRRTDAPSSGELSSVVVCAPSSDAALSVVCGGSSSDYPGLSFFDRPPLPGFPSDRSKVTIKEKT